MQSTWGQAAMAGVILGILVGVWQVVSAALSLLAMFVPIAMGLQLLVLVGLAFAGKDEHGFAVQSGRGILASAVSCPFIAAGSLLTLTVLFPDLQASLEASDPAATVTAQVLGGVFGTLFTGVLLAPLLGAVLRKR